MMSVFTCAHLLFLFLMDRVPNLQLNKQSSSKCPLTLLTVLKLSYPKVCPCFSPMDHRSVRSLERWQGSKDHGKAVRIRCLGGIWFPCDGKKCLARTCNQKGCRHVGTAERGARLRVIGSGEEDEPPLSSAATFGTTMA